MLPFLLTLSQYSLLDTDPDREGGLSDPGALVDDVLDGDAYVGDDTSQLSYTARSAKYNTQIIRKLVEYQLLEYSRAQP